MSKDEVEAFKKLEADNALAAENTSPTNDETPAKPLLSLKQHWLASLNESSNETVGTPVASDQSGSNDSNFVVGTTVAEIVDSFLTSSDKKIRFVKCGDSPILVPIGDIGVSCGYIYSNGGNKLWVKIRRQSDIKMYKVPRFQKISSDRSYLYCVELKDVKKLLADMLKALHTNNPNTRKSKKYQATTALYKAWDTMVDAFNRREQITIQLPETCKTETHAPANSNEESWERIKNTVSILQAEMNLPIKSAFKAAIRLEEQKNNCDMSILHALYDDL